MRDENALIKANVQISRESTSEKDNKINIIGSDSLLFYENSYKNIGFNSDINLMPFPVKKESENIVKILEKEGEEFELETQAKKLLAQKRRLNSLEGSRSIDNYEHIGKIDEGAYGVVYKARDIITGDLVAIKKVKLAKEKDGFPITSIREINILMNYHHENIINIKEVVYGSTPDKIFCVMEFGDFELKALLADTSINNTSKKLFNLSQIKCLFYQLLKGVEFIHNNWIIHRDLKTSNLLYNKNGIAKIADFGLARKYGNPIKPYTPLVVTLWYRAPELLLNCDKYGTAIDIWSCGCILGELFLTEPLFQGNDEIDQLHKIFKLLGTPDDKIWPGFSNLPNAKRINFSKKYQTGNFALREKFPKFSLEDDFVLTDKGFDLLTKLLAYNPEERISAEDALQHPWFKENPPMAQISQMPDLKDYIPKDKNSKANKKLRSLNEEQIKQREKLHNEERYQANIYDGIIEKDENINSDPDQDLKLNEPNDDKNK